MAWEYWNAACWRYSRPVYVYIHCMRRGRLACRYKLCSAAAAACAARSTSNYLFVCPKQESVCGDRMVGRGVCSKLVSVNPRTTNARTVQWRQSEHDSARSLVRIHFQRCMQSMARWQWINPVQFFSVLQNGWEWLSLWILWVLASRARAHLESMQRSTRSTLARFVHLALGANFQTWRARCIGQSRGVMNCRRRRFERMEECTQTLLPVGESKRVI